MHHFSRSRRTRIPKLVTSILDQEEVTDLPLMQVLPPRCRKNHVAPSSLCLHLLAYIRGPNNNAGTDFYVLRGIGICSPRIQPGDLLSSVIVAVCYLSDSFSEKFWSI